MVLPWRFHAHDQQRALWRSERRAAEDETDNTPFAEIGKGSYCPLQGEDRLFTC